MTDQTAFEYRDIHGDVFQARPTVTSDGPRVALEANLSIPVFVPLDRVEQVVAGIRAAARQATAQPAADEGHRPPCVDGDHCGEAAHCPPAVSASYARLQAAATKTNREMAAATLRAYKRIHQLASTATGPIDPSEILDALKDPEPDPARLLAALNDGTPAAGLAAPTNHNTETARARLAALIGYESDEHDAEFEKRVDALIAASLHEAARRMEGAGHDDDAVAFLDLLAARQTAGAES